VNNGGNNGTAGFEVNVSEGTAGFEKRRYQIRESEMFYNYINYILD